MADKELVFTASNGDRVYVETEGLGVLVEGEHLENMQQIQRAHLGAIRDLWARLKESETCREFQRQTIELQTEKVRSLSQQVDSADAHARLYQDRTKDLQERLQAAEKALELTGTNLKRSQAKVYEQIDRIKEITAQRDNAIEELQTLRDQGVPEEKSWTIRSLKDELRRIKENKAAEIAGLKSRIDHLHRAAESDKVKVTELEDTIKELRIEHSPQNMDSPAYKLQRLELRLKGHSPESLKEEIERLKEQLKLNCALTEQQLDKLVERKEEIERLTAENLRLSNAVTSLTENLNEKRNMVDNLTFKLGRREDEAEADMKTIERLQREVKECNAKVGELESTIRALEKNALVAKVDKDHLNDRIAYWKRYSGGLEKDVHKWREICREHELAQRDSQDMDFRVGVAVEPLTVALKGDCARLVEEVASLQKQLKDERSMVARLEVDRKRAKEKYDGFYQKTTEGYQRRDKENNRLVERIDRLEKAIAEEADRKLVAIEPLEDPQGARLIYSDGLQRCYVPVDLSAFRPKEGTSMHTRLKIRSRNDLLDLLSADLEKTSPEGPFSDGSLRLEIQKLMKEVIGG